jgi:hypothetical protein
MSVASFARLRKSFARFFGKPSLSVYAALLQATQFHANFYASRLLPNVFATCVFNLALACLLEAHTPARHLEPTSTAAATASANALPSSDRPELQRACVWLLALGCACFRCDLVLLAFPLLLSALVAKWLSLQRLVKYGLAASLGCVALTVSCDSFFWGRLVWPEFEVLFFNTVLNKSHEWGTQPPLWYWLNALPKALLVAYPLALISPLLGPRGWRSRVWALLWPVLVFIVLYSLLPHKEVRFLFPALPLLTCLAAVSLQALDPDSNEKAQTETAQTEKGHTKPVNEVTVGKAAQTPTRAAASVVWLAMRGVLLISVLLSAAWAGISRFNYPGGHALAMLTNLNNLQAYAAPLCSTEASSSSSASRSTCEAHQASAHGLAEKSTLWVHLTNLACVSGASRFGQSANMLVDKSEGLDVRQLLALAEEATVAHAQVQLWLEPAEASALMALASSHPSYVPRAEVIGLAGVQWQALGAWLDRVRNVTVSSVGSGVGSNGYLTPAAFWLPKWLCNVRVPIPQLSPMLVLLQRIENL